MSENTTEKLVDTTRGIEGKLCEICVYVSAIKYIVNQDENAGPLGTAIDVLASQVGATADSIITGELQSGGCIGSYDAWLKCRG